MQRCPLRELPAGVGQLWRALAGCPHGLSAGSTGAHPRCVPARAGRDTLTRGCALSVTPRPFGGAEASLRESARCPPCLLLSPQRLLSSGSSDTWLGCICLQVGWLLQEALESKVWGASPTPRLRRAQLVLAFPYPASLCFHTEPQALCYSLRC